jgi:hypothetical protein
MAVMAGAGVALAAAFFGAHAGAARLASAGVVAAAAEAAAPRATDNALVPASVWTALTVT